MIPKLRFGSFKKGLSDSGAGEKSLGKKIVNTLVTLQLKGEINQKNENGVAYHIEFDKENLL